MCVREKDVSLSHSRIELTRPAIGDSPSSTIGAAVSISAAGFLILPAMWIFLACSPQCFHYHKHVSTYWMQCCVSRQCGTHRQRQCWEYTWNTNTLRRLSSQPAWSSNILADATSTPGQLHGCFARLAEGWSRTDEGAKCIV